MAICQVGKSTSLFLHKFVKRTFLKLTMHELFSCAGDIAIVMQDAHAYESCDLHLEGHMGT